MRPVQNDLLFSTIKVERGAKAFVSYAQYPALRVPLSPNAAKIYLFNCTNDDALHTILTNVQGEFVAAVQNYDLSPMTETSLRAADGSLLVDLEIPQGGIVTSRGYLRILSMRIKEVRAVEIDLSAMQPTRHSNQGDRTRNSSYQWQGLQPASPMARYPGIQGAQIILVSQVE